MDHMDDTREVCYRGKKIVSLVNKRLKDKKSIFDGQMKCPACPLSVVAYDSKNLSHLDALLIKAMEKHYRKYHS